MELIVQIRRVVEEVLLEHARDPRLAVFEVEVMEDERGYALVGETSEPAAAEALHRRVGVLDGAPIRVEVERLPAGKVAERPYALVRAAAAPMLARPLVSAPIVSQAVLGQRLAILRCAGRWAHCRSEDGYLGWVHRGYLQRMTEVEATEWEVGSGGELCFSLGALVRGADDEVLAQLPWGARVVREAGGVVRLPDGSRGALAGELIAVAEMVEHFPPEGGAVVRTASHWIAAPYLWGGITPAGVDCSGLAQAVYRAHGTLLPRDSDLQAMVGEEIDPGPDFAALLPGDLLFFAEEHDRVTHVALSLGGSRIIHSSLGNGGVRRNDLLGPSGFEEGLRRLFVTARRVVRTALHGTRSFNSD